MFHRHLAECFLGLASCLWVNGVYVELDKLFSHKSFGYRSPAFAVTDPCNGQRYNVVISGNPGIRFAIRTSCEDRLDFAVRNLFTGIVMPHSKLWHCLPRQDQVLHERSVSI